METDMGRGARSRRRRGRKQRVVIPNARVNRVRRAGRVAVGVASGDTNDLIVSRGKYHPAVYDHPRRDRRALAKMEARYRAAPRRARYEGRCTEEWLDIQEGRRHPGDLSWEEIEERFEARAMGDGDFGAHGGKV